MSRQNKVLFCHQNIKDLLVAGKTFSVYVILDITFLGNRYFRIISSDKQSLEVLGIHHKL